MKMILFVFVALLSSQALAYSRICLLNSVESDISWSLITNQRGQPQKIGSWQVSMSADLAQYSCQLISSNPAFYSVVATLTANSKEQSCSIEGLKPDDIVRIRVQAGNMKCELLQSTTQVRITTPARTRLKLAANNQEPIPFDDKTVYFSPIALSNTLLTREVRIYPLSRAGELDLKNPLDREFPNQDINVWGYSFLQALDSVISQYETQIAMVDNKAKTSFAKDLYAIKKIMARTLASTVVPILELPAVTAKKDPEIFDAANTAGFRLYTASLAEAYSEVPIAITLKGKEGPVLYPLMRKQIPQAPLLDSATVQAQYEGAQDLAKLRWGKYQFKYQSSGRYPDTILIETKSSQDLIARKTMHGDLFAQLAAFQTVWPQLSELLAANLALINAQTGVDEEIFKVSQTSLRSLVTLSIMLPQAWLDWALPLTKQVSAKAGFDGAGFEVQETVWVNDKKEEIFLINIKSQNPFTAIPEIAGCDTLKGPKPQSYMFQCETGLLRPDQALASADRVLAIYGIDVLKEKNITGTAQIFRNRNLETDNVTKTQFRMTSSSTAAQPVQPALQYENEIDLSKQPLQGALRLETYISNLFWLIFGADNLRVPYPVTVTISYMSTLSGLPVIVPVTIINQNFSLPDDFSTECPLSGSFSCRVSDFLRNWVAQTKPNPDGKFIFDVSIFPAGSGEVATPLVRVKNITLPYKSMGERK